MNKEDLRVIKTRDNIENTFLFCLKEKSFDNVSVKMIVERARINRSTFYRNYEDKYDLLNQLLDSVTDVFRGSLDCSFVTMRYKNASAYWPYLIKMLHYFKDHREELLILWSAALPVNVYDKMTNIMSRDLLEAIDTSYSMVSENEIYANLYAELFAAMSLSTVRWWLTTAPEIPCDEIARIMTKNIEKGLFWSLEHLYNNS